MPEGLFTADGSRVTIMTELGHGGEASVYEVQGSQGFVAKIYNSRHLPDQAKRDKLALMVKVQDTDLSTYTAWPHDLLFRSHGGPLVGFLMPRVTDRSAVHKVYSPAQRKIQFPRFGWDYLLTVAYNVPPASTPFIPMTM